MVAGSSPARPTNITFILLTLKQKMKANRLFLALIAAAMLGINSSCKKKTEYPRNPKDKEVYVDSYGNRSVWNSAMGIRESKSRITDNFSYFIPHIIE